MNPMDRRIREEVRLIILRELNGQSNGRITSTALTGHLRDVWGIDREREWVEAEMAWMQEMGAIDIVSAGSVKIACLNETGRRHLRHARFIPGILVSTAPIETI